jgi:hypothetical protein
VSALKIVVLPELGLPARAMVRVATDFMVIDEW